jgi:hypothetical protein
LEKMDLSGGISGKVMEKPVLTPLAKGGETALKEVGKTLEKTGKRRPSHFWT